MRIAAITVLLFANVSLGADMISYGVGLSSLHGAARARGWELDQTTAVGTSSAAQFHLISDGFCLTAAARTNGGLTPFRQNPRHDIEVDSMSIGFALTRSRLPALLVSMISYRGEAEVTGSQPLYDSGRLLNTGDTFDVGMVYQSCMMWGLWTSLDEEPAPRGVIRAVLLEQPSIHSGVDVFLGAGFARLVFLAVEEYFTGRGFVEPVNQSQKR